MCDLRGVLYESTEEVGPRDIIHRLLFGADGSGHNLSIQMVREHVQQATRDNNKLGNINIAKYCGNPAKYCVTLQNKVE